jgi:DNA-directed RNA polymerase specialized sigma24 family protein
MRTRKFRLGREPPSGGLTWWRAGSRSQIPAPRAERDADRQAQDADRGVQSADREVQSADRAARDADRAMIALYQAHYRSLVQLTALLVSDLATAEIIVQESFAAVHESWHALPGTDAALSYLRWSVVHRSRSVLHRSWPVTRHADGMYGLGRPGDGPGAGLLPPGSAVLSALQALPARQREVMVLRYFAELSEAEIASATGMSPAAVRSNTARAMSSLRAGLRRAGDQGPAF